MSDNEWDLFMLSSDVIQSLENKIRLWNHEYYDLHSPSVSDELYDHWVDLLKRDDPNNPVLLERSQSYDQDFEHKIPMGSLAKLKTTGEIFEKFKNKTITITPKLDGAALSLHYCDGKLFMAVTRGRTETGKGKIVTQNARNIKGIPHTLPYQFNGEIRGEVIITHQDWEIIKDDFSNQRNAASGGLMSKDPEDTKKRELTFYAYRLISDTFSPFTHSHSLEIMREWCFNVPECDVLIINTIKDVDDIIATWEKIYNNQKYQTDGIVLRIDNDREYKEMGVVGGCWDGGAAFKYENQKATTTIRDIIWETGNLGYVTPVAIFDQVEIGGSKITRCTLNNPTWMRENGNPSIGAIVAIEKCGDIIPGLSCVIFDGKGVTNEPTRCPSCNTLLVQEMNVDGGLGVKLRCPNTNNCPARIRGNILNTLRRLGIKGIADSTLNSLIDSGAIREPWELFDLDFYQLVCAGFGKKQSDNIQNSLKDINTKVTSIFAAIGLDGWGKRMFDKLQEDPYYTDDRLITFEFEYNRLSNVDGIGPVRAKTLVDAFSDPGSYSRKFITEMMKRVNVKIQEKKEVKTTNITGLNFLITGTLSKERSEVIEDIKNAGGGIVSGVNKKLNYLVVGALDKPTSKIKKAESMNIPRIDEEALYRMING